MSNCSFVTKFIPAYLWNYTTDRSAYSKIQEITLHHIAGNMTIEALGALWQKVGRKGSSHYGVQHGKIGQYVDESDIAWTNSNWASNIRAVTIEVANSTGAPEWKIAEDTLSTLIQLVADIARRNGLVPLVPGKNLTWHSMYAATSCPGPYLLGKINFIAEEANKLLLGNTSVIDTPKDENPVISSGIKAGDLVTIQRGATTYDGVPLASFVYDRLHVVKEVKGDRVVLTYNGTVIAAVHSGKLLKEGQSAAEELKVGDTVKITATHYMTNQVIPEWVKKKTHVITKISGESALLGSKENGIYSWVSLSGLIPG